MHNRLFFCSVVRHSELGRPAVHIPTLEVLDGAKHIVQVVCGANDLFRWHSRPRLLHRFLELDPVLKIRGKSATSDGIWIGD